MNDAIQWSNADINIFDQRNHTECIKNCRSTVYAQSVTEQDTNDCHRYIFGEERIQSTERCRIRSS